MTRREPIDDLIAIFNATLDRFDKRVNREPEMFARLQRLVEEGRYGLWGLSRKDPTPICRGDQHALNADKRGARDPKGARSSAFRAAVSAPDKSSCGRATPEQRCATARGFTVAHVGLSKSRHILLRHHQILVRESGSLEPGRWRQLGGSMADYLPSFSNAASRQRLSICTRLSSFRRRFRWEARASSPSRASDANARIRRSDSST